jgi:glycosidase
MKKIIIMLSLPGLLSIYLCSCKTKPVADFKANYPEWVKNVVIYEVNTRQYTPEGTFKAFETHLPRLKELGVDILWFMPIHPIGELNRKVPDGMTSSLGSYYSVRDYKGVNPEYGTEEDFTNLVKKAHEMGFKVIIDWVANHTAWDNAWVAEHPDWYVKDSLTGKLLAPFDWTDVVKLNYKNQEMRKEMIASMKYWIEKCDIDGFRCDVAGEVPVDFWEQARAELEKTKPMFMLAENEDKPELLKKAFDANYGWGMHHIMHQVAQGKDSVYSIVKQVLKVDSVTPKNAFQMNFITNHDENSWNGTAREKFGDGEGAFAVLTYTLPGMPLIYSGQEAGLDHRLAFFVKDSIDWNDNDFSSFYKKLDELKHTNEALWNAPYGGIFEMVKNNQPKKVLSFIREKGSSKVVVIANLSNETVTVNLKGDKADGDYTDVFSGAKFTLFSTNPNLTLHPWGYLVAEKK